MDGKYEQQMGTDMFVPRLIEIVLSGFRQEGFLRDRSANTAVEFGLILFPFIGLFGATIDAALLYYKQTQIQIVTDNVSRLLRVNSVERYAANQEWSELDYAAFIQKYVCTWQKPGGGVEAGTLGKMFDCSKLVMSVQSPAAWSRAYMDADFRVPPQSGRMRLPAGDAIGVVRIGYPVDSYFHFLGKSTSRIATGENPDGTISGSGIKREHALVGVAAFRVEPGAAQ